MITCFSARWQEVLATLLTFSSQNYLFKRLIEMGSLYFVVKLTVECSGALEDGIICCDEITQLHSKIASLTDKPPEFSHTTHQYFLLSFK